MQKAHFSGKFAACAVTEFFILKRGRVQASGFNHHPLDKYSKFSKKTQIGGNISIYGREFEQFP